MKKKFLPTRYRKNRKPKYEKVPEGFYCYKLTGKTGTYWDKKYKKENSYNEIKTCPFFTWKNHKSYCQHLHSHGTLLFDQIKECSINKID